MGTFIDYKHNKIVAETASEAFVRALERELLPLLKTRFGDSLLGVQMYEDYVSDNFKYDGEWYYPFTAVTESGAEHVWVKWKLSRAAFKTPSPYAFTGERVGFELCDEVPSPFVEKLQGRAFYYEGGFLRLNIESAVSDPLFLSGKYSQSFVDGLAKSLTPLIEQTMGVVGIADSTIELTLVFSPESYFEHTSEKVTYRRLLVSDKTSAPRDLWVKWTSLTSARAYSVSDSVSASDIRFELGEDVSQKIREKEYRFLLGAGKDKYHIAMGRKNVTGWRELIKRALRKGELTKVDAEDEAISVLADQLVVIPEQKPAEEVLTPTPEPIAVFENTAPETDSTSDDDPVALALKALGISSEEYRDDEDDYDSEETDELDDFYGEDGSDSAPEGVRVDDENEERELDELTRMAMAAIKAARADGVGEEEAETEEQEEEEPSDESPTVISLGDDSDSDDSDGEVYADSDEEIYDAADSDEEEIYEDTLEEEGDTHYSQTIVPDEPTAEEYEDGEEDDDFGEDMLNEETDETASEGAPLNAEEAEAKIRRELEAKIRLEYESEARRRAEEEAERLRREHDRLKEENERLQREARLDEIKKQQLEEARRSETEKLRAEIEAQMRAEARERERLAEAARAAVEEQRKLEAQRLREERERFEEEKRQDEIRRREEERARLEEERAKEADRIRRETEERVRAEYEAELAKTKNEAPPSEEKKETAIDPNYTYTSKTVKLLFRRSVDPNITARIYEIIKATLEYYGKDKIYLKIKATVPNNETVNLEFVKIPMEEMDLLSNIIKVLGNSGLGIAKAIVE